ncbi:MFS transporter [Desulfotomaculum copahuensis]|uniref:MFS transporter n=1 Tax=Desulfotomaculum copahuensis TaxID=1838280 RepID=A0A1B7LIB3_9FIRM|nr:MFS transporter [Desulfotomaculum copahuensis]OAT86165.1 MFS transporter [Desulfotomaculum copahuensis]
MSNRTTVLRLPHAIDSLGERNFRLFWLGQAVSLMGTWMQSTAQGWLVLHLTNSAFLLGLVTSIQFLPLFLFSLPAGEIADRLPKKKVLYATQCSMMLLAAILGILILTGTVRYWHILLLAGLLGTANAFDNPTRQSFVPGLVEKKNIMNAIVLNSAAVQGARMVGPALAGLAIGRWGMASSFFLNAASFITVLFGLLLIRVPAKAAEKQGKIRPWPRIAEGLHYIRHSPPMLSTIMLMGLVSTFAINFTVLVPVLAKANLGQGAEGYGFLMSAMGIGALAGAIIMAMLSHLGPRRLFLYGGGTGLCLFQILLAATDNYRLAFLALGLTGWMSVTFITSANTRLQVETTDNLRGRVMSVYSLVFLGVNLPGSLLSGFLAHIWGAPAALAAGAAAGLVSIAAVFAWEQRAAARAGRSAAPDSDAGVHRPPPA